MVQKPVTTPYFREAKPEDRTDLETMIQDYYLYDKQDIDKSSC